MKKIAILGTGPLPIEKDSYIYSSSNRTWQIAKGLVDAGHRVHVISFRPTRTENGVRINDSELRTCREGDFTLDSVEELAHFRNDTFLKDRISEFQPDALVGVNAFPAGRAATLNLPYPLWADLNGFNMGEVQIRARLTGNDGAISQGWDHELAALCKADVFSATSGPQRHALIGQLAAIGRLRGATCGYEFVHVVPTGREDPLPAMGRCTLRDKLGPEAFLALWIGCYNFQFDLDTLFEGMETAMRNCPHVHFVSTGGQVDGHNETTYARFRERVAGSPCRERFHFEGWLAWEDFDALMRGCDVGVSLDIPCYETEFGARNRLTEMMRVGLPAITTPGPEIAEDIWRWEAGWQSPPGSAEAFAEKILEAAGSREECRRRGENSRRAFLEQYTIPTSTAPILTWAESPWTAPDRGLRPLLLPDTQDSPAGGRLSWGSRFLNLFKVSLLLFLFASSCLPSFAENLAPFRAGAAKQDITPPFATGMGGFFDRLTKFSGVHDPVFARALVCANTHTVAVVVSTDLISMSHNVVEETRRRIESHTGIPPGNILISAAHNHSGPSGYQDDQILGVDYDQALFQFLTARIVATVTEAYKDLKPASIGFLSGSLPGITRNRQQDNTEVIDPEVGVLKVWESESRKVIATLFNFTAHPVIVGSSNLQISGEFPGFAEKTVEDVLGGVALFTQGACGDVTLIREGPPFLEIERLGRVLAGEVIKTAEQIKPSKDLALFSRFENVAVGSRILPSTQEAKAALEVAKSHLSEGESSKLPPSIFHRLERDVSAAETTQNLCRYVSLQPEKWKSAARASVHVLQLGPLVLVGIPGELFVEYGLEMKQRVRQMIQHPLMLAGYANGYSGYIVTPRAKLTGGYEQSIARVDEHAGRVLTEVAMRIVEENIHGTE